MLLALSEGGALAENELREVLAVLESAESKDFACGPSVDDVYECLLVLGKTKLSQYRRIIEKFLEAEDALTVALVLETLCLRWELTAEYLEQVISFALGAPWDKDEDVRQTALKILGEYMYANRREAALVPAALPKSKLHLLHVLDLLRSVFADEEAQQWTRQSAYYALCRAAGRNWDELPPECKALDLSAESADLDQDVLRYVAELLCRKESSTASSNSSE